VRPFLNTQFKNQVSFETLYLEGLFEVTVPEIHIKRGEILFVPPWTDPVGSGSLRVTE